MLTRMRVTNFKMFADAEIELGSPVVFAGPNNSGKTTALEALALWELGVKHWFEKKGRRGTARQRTGTSLDRRDLINVPVPRANLLWHQCNVRRSALGADGQKTSPNVLIKIVVEGIRNGVRWKCGMEFDYANPESFYCRPMERPSSGGTLVPPQALEYSVAYLPPMSGLASVEDRLDDGSIRVRIGEGRTAEVLRNLCFRMKEQDAAYWEKMVTTVREMFSVTLNDPVYRAERGQIEMTYSTESGVVLDLSCAGRGLQQLILLLAYMGWQAGTVLLLDEPDAHLEILRQREVYSMLTALAAERDTQVLVATHSETLLTEAQKDNIVAFLGTPHPVSTTKEVLKALRDIPYHQYHQAELRGWVLYLEGPSDLTILQSSASVLAHPAVGALASPFVHYVGNNVGQARHHYHGLRAAYPELRGFMLFDRAEREDWTNSEQLVERCWSRYEIENYFAFPDTLIRWAGERRSSDLWSFENAEIRRNAMLAAVNRHTPPSAVADLNDRFWSDTRISDSYLDRILREYFAALRIEYTMSKTEYHTIAKHVCADQLPPEVSDVLSALHAIATAGPP